MSVSNSNRENHDALLEPPPAPMRPEKRSLLVAAAVSAAAPPPLSVCLVSSNSALDNGGTAAYIRYLGNHLREQNAAVCGIARRIYPPPEGLVYDKADPPAIVETGNGWQTQIVGPKPFLRPALRQVLRLITRPPLRNAGVSLFNAAYAEAVDAAMPPNTNVVHYVGNGWELMGFSALQAAQRRGAAFVVMPFIHPGAWGDSPLDIRLYNEADAVFVCSQYEGDYLAKRGVEPARLVRTGLAPAASAVGNGARFRESEGLGNRPLVLFVGRKQKYKGYHALRQAMEAVEKAVPDVCLVAIGTDDEPPYPPVAPENLRDLGEMKVNPADQQRKSDALAACDVFCMPSAAEAFGIVYVEAWANGKPVVGGPAPAVRELIENNVTGYSVEQNPTDIAAVLIRLLQDPEGRRRMGAAGLVRQQKEFNWQAIATHHMNTYVAALNKITIRKENA